MHSLSIAQTQTSSAHEQHVRSEAMDAIYNTNTHFFSYLDSQLFSQILEFLSPSDLHRASLVNKSWKVLSSDDKLRHRASVKVLNGTHWEQKFEVIASYNLDTLEDAQFVFLGEKHNQHRYQRPNGHLTSVLATKKCIASFIEGTTSMRPIQDPQGIANCKTYLLIDDTVMNNIQFLGWDMDEKVHQHTLEAVWDPEKDGPKESCSDKVKVLNTSINEYNQILTSIIPGFPPYLLYENAADDLMIKFEEFSGAFF